MGVTRGRRDCMVKEIAICHKVDAVKRELFRRLCQTDLSSTPSPSLMVSHSTVC